MSNPRIPRPFFCGNWKLWGSLSDSLALATGVRDAVAAVTAATALRTPVARATESERVPHSFQLPQKNGRGMRGLDMWFGTPFYFKIPGRQAREVSCLR